MGKKIVSFKIKDEEFAFEIMKIVEVIKIKEITEVPTAPSFMEGIINLRGKIIPIIDLRKRFNLETKEKTKKNRIIIIEYQKNQLAGVIVDEVQKVLNIKKEEILPPPSTLVSAGGKYIEAIIKIEDRIIVLLNIEKIFTEEEKDDLAQIIKMEEDKIEKRTDS